jgi:hypothetical protein
MAETGKIPPTIPVWPTRPTHAPVRRKQRPQEERPPQRDPRARERDQPQEDTPHVDEYA